MSIKAFIVAIVTTSSCMLAYAEGAAAYVGAAAGPTHLNLDCMGGSCDNTDSGSKLFFGYYVTPQWAVELNVIDFGKATSEGFGSNGELESSAVALGAAFHSGMGAGWSTVARLGLAKVKSEANSGWTALLPNLTSESSVAPYVGVGFGYSFTFGLRLEAGIDLSVVKAGSERGGVQLFSAGLSYEF